MSAQYELKTKSEDKIWTVPFAILTFCNFVLSLTMWLLSVEMVEYAHVVYGVSETLAASTLTAYVFSSALARIFLGAKTDEWGAKKTLIGVFIANSICPFAYIFCSDIWMLLAVRCAHGVAFGLSAGAAASAAVMVLPDSRRGEGIGYFTTSQAIATAVGPFTAITSMNALGSFTAVFVALGILCVATLVLVLVLKLPAAASGRKVDRGQRKKLSLGDLIELSLVPLVGVVALAFIGHSSLTAFMTLYTSELGLSSFASLFFVAYAVALVASRPRVGRHVDAHGPKVMMRLSLVVMFAGFVVMGAIPTVSAWLGVGVAGVVLLVAAAMTGFGVGNVQSTIQTIVAFVTPKERLGKANSTFFLGLDVGSSVGPVAVGLAIPFVGYSGAYFAIAFIAIAGLVLYGWCARRYEA